MVAQDQTEKRLDRIETKIDKLSEIVISLAHVEEKISSLESDQAVTSNSLYKVHDRINGIESRVSSTEVTIRVINRLFWVLITTAIAAYLANVFTA